ncbi:MAG: hypothetical protein IJG84_09045 [Kiritimatiellae bacterium]|nr:hypothetical protein [Kiritimatiellia bacterium]
MKKTLPEVAKANGGAAGCEEVAPPSPLFQLAPDEQRKMKDIIVELCPNEIVEDSSDKMLSAIKELCPDVAKMQQNAIEASKLLTATDDRLRGLEKAGFFKKLWYSISGKTGSIERATQRDLVSMQKLAWWFLMELQSHNMLQSRAIVVIRNNLKDILVELSETNEMIKILKDRLDERLKNLEYSIEEVKWVVYLDGRKADFPDPKKSPVICALSIVFDYLKTFRDFTNKRCDESTWSMPLDIVAPVRTALAKFGIVDKFGLGQDYTVQDFIGALLSEELKLEGDRRKSREKIKEITRLCDVLDWRREIEYKYALKVVKGIGFTALYSYNEQMDNVWPALDALEKDKPEKIARKIVAQMMVNAPKTKYSIVDLAAEIIGGCQIVMEMDFVANKHKQKMVSTPSVCEFLPPQKTSEKEGEVSDNGLEKSETATVCFQDVCGKCDKLKVGAKFRINKGKVGEMLGDSYLTDYLPDGVSVDVDEDGDWVLPKGGEVEFVKGTRNVNEDLLGDNPAALDVDYDDDNGSFSGSFKVYQVTGRTIKSKTFNVKGALVGDVGYGMAYGDDCIGSFSVMIG